MTEQQIDTIVNLILQRLQPAVLVMVTSADGYRDLIHQRLARCGERLHLALDETISDSVTVNTRIPPPLLVWSS